MLNHDTLLLTDSPSKQSLHIACAGVCRRFGFQHFLFISKIPKPPQPRLVIIQGVSQNNSTVCYERRGLMRVSARADISNTEVDNLLSHFASDHKQQLIKVLQSNQINIPLINSMSFPVFGKSRDVGLLILGGAGDSCRSNTTTAQLSYTQEFAHSLHQAVIRLVRDDNATKETQKLTKRELECLHWAALGKTNWEIGEILSISKRTVVFHLQNSTKKLQTSNRYHTVARAVSLGLVDRQG